MINIESKEINSYLGNRNIKIINEKFKSKDLINEEEIAFQVDLIVRFHKLIGEYKENLIPRIGSNIGKDLEYYKFQLKRLRADLEYRKKKQEKNLLDLNIISNGNELLNKGEKAINHILRNNYKKLIQRSMINYEVCLGKVDDSNLRYTVSIEDGIEINTIKYLSYNLKEHDLYNYIKRLKKKNIPIEVNKIIEYYVDSLGLSSDSMEYLKGFIYYPNESLRIWDKYILNKKELSFDKYLNDFKKGQIIDNIYIDEIIGGDFGDK